MRRSEALEIIWEAINELEDADLILTRLEKAGMKPPTYLKKFQCTQSDTRSQGTESNRYCCNDHFYYPTREGSETEGWEPENE